MKDEKNLKVRKGQIMNEEDIDEERKRFEESVGRKI